MTPIIPSLAATVASLRQRLSDCARDDRGVSAVEFALVLPLMVTLYLGGVEVSQGLTIDRKVTLAARTITDLAARTDKIPEGEMTNILNASKAVLLPYSTANAKVTISQVLIDDNGNATIDWSVSKNGTVRAKGSTVTLPSALKVKGALIWGEVSYDYKPVIGYVITGTMTLSDQIYMRPRKSDSGVQYPAS
ncbi:MAG: pilus assembly protein [Rhizobiales bacterium]|nr:pilus assembly protein [Hyphomicrobiales bacterium]